MRIAVCIKQVPVVSALEFDPITRTILRAGVPAEVSAFDVRALLKAVDLRQQAGGEVVVVTMGPPQAREALEYCLALGADSALHLCDPAFAGADTLATARALAAALAPYQFDLILCGRTSIDAETGQVGPEIAELLDVPQLTAVSSIELESDRTILAVRETDSGSEVVRVSLPCLITAAEDLVDERFPDREEQAAAAVKSCIRLAAADLATDPGVFGSSGSPTWVGQLELVASHRREQIIAGEPAVAAATLAGILIEEHGLFQEWRNLAEARPSRPLPQLAGHHGPVWVLAEEHGGHLRPASHELLQQARRLARALGTSTEAIVFSPQVDAAPLSQLAVDHVLLGSDPRFFPLDVEICVAAMADAIERRQPAMVLASSSSFGRDVMPRLAARLGLGLTGDCIDLGLDEDGRLIQLKPAFGGAIVAPVFSRTIPQLATVRPGMFGGRISQWDEVNTMLGIEPLPYQDGWVRRIECLQKSSLAAAATELDSADIVIGIGKGIGEWANFARIEPLVDLLGAALCSTRDVNDVGWMPKQHQVGITGRAISPRLYIAIGVRGAFEHTVGIRAAGLVVAINRSARAPIFKAADYGIVADYADVIPHLHAELVRRKPV